MGRMHSFGKGISQSALPYRRSVPTWLKHTKEEIEDQIIKLAKKGLSPSQIGVILRDSHGVAQVRFVTGNKILRVLKSKGLAPSIPEDLHHLIKKAVSIRKHLERNRFRRSPSKILLLSLVSFFALTFFILPRDRNALNIELNQASIRGVSTFIGKNALEKQEVAMHVAESSSTRLKEVVHNVTSKPPFVKTLIDETKVKLRTQIKTYFENENLDINFTPGEVIPTNRVRRLLIASSWRSGSTFLGDMMSSNPWTFYNYEPLLLYDRKPNITAEEIEQFIQLLRDIFTCNLTSRTDYFEFMKKKQFVLNKNLIIKKTCFQFKNHLCFDPNLHSEVCRYLPFNVIKTVRADLIHFKSLLDDPTLDLRVVYLIRDPRGSFHSRDKLDWCITPMCYDVPTVCENMLSNLKTAEIFQDKYRGRFLTVRFEDLCLFPERTTKRILDVAGLPYHGEIETFLKTHTRNQGTGRKRLQQSTFRTSADVPFMWRGSLSFQRVAYIQEHCYRVLNWLGMTSFENDDKYRNSSIPVMMGT